MKKFIYWMMGKRAGRTITGIWNWLWGLPVQSGNQIAVDMAQESLQSMQQSIFQLTKNVSILVAAYQRAKEKYEAKKKECRIFENQAAIAHNKNDQEAARLAMSKAILVEKLLPQLKSQVDQAEKVVIAAKDKLSREKQKLETYKLHLENLKDLAEVNEALAAITKANTDIEMDSERSQFEEAEAAVEKRSLQVFAQVELSENPTEKLESQLEQLTLDEEISRRLQNLNQSKMN